MDDLTPERRELLRKARIVHVSREWGTALLTEFADHILLLEDALADEKARAVKAERELAICERVSQMNANAHMAAHARAVKAEQERDEAREGYHRVEREYDRMLRFRTAAEAAYAALVARIEALADEWIAEDDMTQWGVHTKSRCGHALRALTEKDALCIECGDHRGWTVQPDWNTGDAVQTQCRACSEHECPTPSAVTEEPTDD